MCALLAAKNAPSDPSSATATAIPATAPASRTGLRLSSPHSQINTYMRHLC